MTSTHDEDEAEAQRAWDAARRKPVGKDAKGRPLVAVHPFIVREPAQYRITRRGDAKKAPESPS